MDSVCTQTIPVLNNSLSIPVLNNSVSIPVLNNSLSIPVLNNSVSILNSVGKQFIARSIIKSCKCELMVTAEIELMQTLVIF